MPQMIYSVAAILLLGVAFLNINRKVHGTDERLTFSELTVEMTGVGAEILDEIGKHPFDDVVAASNIVVARGDLSATAGDAASVCDPDDPDYAGCLTIGDFDGKTATRNRTRTHSLNGTPTTYTVAYSVTSIDVEYVSEAPPHAVTAAPTFAKEVTIHVETPALLLSDGTNFGFDMRRIYTYPDL